VHAGFRSKDRARGLDALALELSEIRPVRLDVIDQGLIDSAIAKARRRVPGPIDSLSDEELNRQFE